MGRRGRLAGRPNWPAQPARGAAVRAGGRSDLRGRPTTNQSTVPTMLSTTITITQTGFGQQPDPLPRRGYGIEECVEPEAERDEGEEATEPDHGLSLGLLAVGFADLQDFLRALERDGDLARVDDPGRPGPRGGGDRPAGGARAGARRCCSSTRDAAGCRWRSTYSARRGAWPGRLGVQSLDEIGERIGDLLKTGAAARCRRIAGRARQGRPAAGGAAPAGKVAPCRRSCSRTTTSTCRSCRESRPGRMTAACS